MRRREAEAAFAAALDAYKEAVEWRMRAELKVRETRAEVERLLGMRLDQIKPPRKT